MQDHDFEIARSCVGFRSRGNSPPGEPPSMKLRILTVAAAGVMALSLAACHKKEEAPAPAAADAAAAAAPAAAEAAAPAAAEAAAPAAAEAAAPAAAADAMATTPPAAPEKK